MKNILIALTVANIFCACAFRTAPTVSTRKPILLEDGQIGFEETKAKGSAGIAWGDARQAFESEKLTAGKTLSIGTKGSELETSSTNVAPIMKSVGGLIGEAVRTYTTGGM